MPCLWILGGDSPTFLWVDWWHLWADVEWWTSVALKSSFRWFRGFHGSTCKDLKTEAEAGYQFFLVGMMGHFLFQVVLVAIAVTCFTKSRFEWNFCGSDLTGFWCHPGDRKVSWDGAAWKEDVAPAGFCKFLTLCCRERKRFEFVKHGEALAKPDSRCRFSIDLPICHQSSIISNWCATQASRIKMDQSWSRPKFYTMKPSISWRFTLEVNILNSLYSDLSCKHCKRCKPWHRSPQQWKSTWKPT